LVLSASTIVLGTTAAADREPAATQRADSILSALAERAGTDASLASAWVTQMIRTALVAGDPSEDLWWRTWSVIREHRLQDSARAVARLALSRRPGCPYARYVAIIALGCAPPLPEEALRLALETSRLFPDSVLAWALLGAVAADNEDNALAVRAYDRVLAMDTLFFLPWFDERCSLHPCRQDHRSLYDSARRALGLPGYPWRPPPPRRGLTRECT
jgi:hypothetical protein